MPSAPTHDYNLGIAGLPPLLDAMITGGLYGVQTSSPPTRPALVASALAATLRCGMPAVLISSGSPQRLLDRAREQGLDNLEQAAWEEKLFLFRLKEFSAKNVFRHGPQRFLQELDHFEIPKGALIVFDGADEMFTLQDAVVASEQVRNYRDWIQRKEACGLLVFTQLSGSSQFSGTYQALQEHLDGAVRLESGNEQLEWLADFWISPTGVVASRSLRARIESNGALAISEQPVRQDEAAATQAVANDENDIFSLDSTLVGIAQHGHGKWIFADSVVGLLHACRSAVAATIILTYDRSTDLRQLAQAAHTLRITLGKRMRIVVRELDASLRYQNELLLLNLGVNLIIHRDVPVSRFVLALESLRGQIFDRDIEVDFDAALASVTPGRKQGYLPPAVFSHEVQEIMARSKALAVPYALVGMELPEQLDPASAVARFRINRAGDLITATDRQILVFLSACPQVNLLPTLKRLAGENVEDEFPCMRFSVKEREIETELAALNLQPEAPGLENAVLQPAV